MKTEIEVKQSNRLINCGEVILVSSALKGKSNIVTLAWHMPICQDPAMVAVSIAKSHFSHWLIKESQEFVINIPTVELLPQIVYCGSHSGKVVDKFKESGLSAEKANILKQAPLIKECIGHLEVSLKDIKDFGDHSIFIGEVVHTSVEAEMFKEVWQVDKVKLVFHLGGRFFTCPDKIKTV